METWKIIYNKWDPKEEPLREASCALGNGYMVTRGAAEESRDDGIHYSGTYLAGGYNRLKSHIAGKVIECDHLSCLRGIRVTTDSAQRVRVPTPRLPHALHSAVGLFTVLCLLTAIVMSDIATAQPEIVQ